MGKRRTLEDEICDEDQISAVLLKDKEEARSWKDITASISPRKIKPLKSPSIRRNSLQLDTTPEVKKSSPLTKEISIDNAAKEQNTENPTTSSSFLTSSTHYKPLISLTQPISFPKKSLLILSERRPHCLALLLSSSSSSLASSLFSKFTSSLSASSSFSSSLFSSSSGSSSSLPSTIAQADMNQSSKDSHQDPKLDTSSSSSSSSQPHSIFSSNSGLFKRHSSSSSSSSSSPSSSSSSSSSSSISLRQSLIDSQKGNITSGIVKVFSLKNISDTDLIKDGDVRVQECKHEWIERGITVMSVCELKDTTQIHNGEGSGDQEAKEEKEKEEKKEESEKREKRDYVLKCYNDKTGKLIVNSRLFPSSIIIKQSRGKNVIITLINEGDEEERKRKVSKAIQSIDSIIRGLQQEKEQEKEQGKEQEVDSRMMRIEKLKAKKEWLQKELHEPKLNVFSLMFRKETLAKEFISTIQKIL
ncbi:hypothetical protein ADUPG1_008038 [Aduncisulcus paluster]|uniref:Uncharacterized protein n=1 Tax=Aduncisulcus paluster TaxID=2918883 RepID=A0ABQ5KQL9_9EUKA|nr:hypothetical protein ADUPG1_008038 [Aduncisulcus paluster]